MIQTIKNYVKELFGIYNFDSKSRKDIWRYIELYKKGGKLNKLLAIRLFNKASIKYSCSIWPQASYGKNIYIAHAMGIRIGRTASIGDNCKIYPFVHIMASVKGDDKRYKDGQRRHAKIGNDCILGAHCMIIGPITIGNNVTIGAGAIVTKDVPDNTVVKNVNQFRPKVHEE